MHESLSLLDAALELTRQEDAALAAEDEERLEELCEERAKLMARAWEKRDGCDAAQLLSRLEAIQNAQNALTNKAASTSDALRQTLQQSREQGNRLSGYHKVVARQQHSLLLQTRG